jgi:hypothetical protein
MLGKRAEVVALVGTYDELVKECDVLIAKLVENFAQQRDIAYTATAFRRAASKNVEAVSVPQQKRDYRGRTFAEVFADTPWFKFPQTKQLIDFPPKPTPPAAEKPPAPPPHPQPRFFMLNNQALQASYGKKGAN